MLTLAQAPESQDTVTPASAVSVLILHNSYLETSGEDAVVRFQTELLKKRGHSVVTCFRDSREFAGSASLKLRTAARLVTGWGRHQFEQLLSAAPIRPKVALAHNVYPLIGNDVFWHLRRAGIRTVHFVHAQRYSCLNGYRFRNGAICDDCQQGRVLPGMLRGCYRGSRLQSLVQGLEYTRTRRIAPYHHNVDRFVVLSQFAHAQLAAQGVPYDKIRVLPNALNCSHSLDVSPPLFGRYVLFIGRLTEMKGVATVTDALAGTDIPLVIAGDGPQASELRRRASTPNITFTGVVTGNRKKELIENARIVVLPSIGYEAFPISLLEAMSAGRPVVASDIAGISEIVRGGTDGRLCTPGDIEIWRRCLLDLWDDSSELLRLGRAAKTRSKFYSEETYYDGLKAILSELLRPESAGSYA